MSEMIVVECDHGDGECLRRFEGFALHADERFRNETLVKDGKHLCPVHKTHVVKDADVRRET